MVNEPHSVTVHCRRVATDGAFVKGYRYDPGVPATCHIEPTSSTRVLDDWGIETARPHRVIWGPKDLDRFPLSSLILSDGSAYEVRAEPREYRFGLVTDHCETIAERLESVPEVKFA